MSALCCDTDTSQFTADRKGQDGIEVSAKADITAAVSRSGRAGCVAAGVLQAEGQLVLAPLLLVACFV